MSSKVDEILLADPVCGQPVDWTSPHRHVHGGALFCFCSGTCRSRFAAHPSRMAFIALSGGVRVPRVEPEAVPIDAPAPAKASAPARVLRAWRERRLAASCCSDLLALYKAVAATHPELSGTRLYEEVVVAHRLCDPEAARAVLRQAQQSYAIWPVERELRFRDVVHYIAVSQILVADRATPWAEADVKRIVDASIPNAL